jgi:hypothetical protein
VKKRRAGRELHPLPHSVVPWFVRDLPGPRGTCALIGEIHSPSQSVYGPA